MARNVQRKFPAGRYVCLYEGEQQRMTAIG